MTYQTQENAAVAVEDPFAVIERAVSDCAPEQIQAAQQSLAEISSASREAFRDDVVSFADLLTNLFEIVGCSSDSDGSEATADIEPIRQFIADGATSLRAALLDDDGKCDDLEAKAEHAKQRWGEWLDAIVAAEMPTKTDEAYEWNCESAHDDERIIDSGQVDLILSAISSAEIDADVITDDSPIDLAPAPPQMPSNTVIEGELLEAYLDDAHRCLATIEASFLAFEQNPQNRQPVEQVCRELHTLKGASASVGLTDLASFLHEVEETLQASSESTTKPSDVESILKSIDAIRDQISSLASGSDDAAKESLVEAPKANTDFSDTGIDNEETLRIKSKDLDRLMDMLAELIMLRNCRESTTDQLQSFNDDLIRCKSRLLLDRDTCPASKPPRISRRSASEPRRTHPLADIAREMQEIHRGQRELCERVSDENNSITQFIRQFRQAVVKLRRVPISGLFRRLQRVVRDAAKAEGKQIRLELSGETAGLERSLQERLYEPLLHIVRNAVSHGIEREQQRNAAGKDSTGTITLEAVSETHLLHIEVRDDGGGLDYDALRRRGVQRGLIAPDRLPSDEELAQLIFHPGFSTRSDASEISGRGVGMDVVSSTLDRMRGWVEVQSSPGRGTRVRLSIPLRSGIEHAMVFRASGQLFAIPLHCIDRVETQRAVRQEKSLDEDLLFARLSQVLGIDSDYAVTTARIVLQQKLLQQPATLGKAQRLALMIDEILGPEEMVVRPLPPLFRHHPLLTGATQSGTGEVILVLDGRRLFDLAVPVVGTCQSNDRDVIDTQTTKEQR